jgi:hypothetical protein
MSQSSRSHTDNVGPRSKAGQQQTPHQPEPEQKETGFWSALGSAVTDALTSRAFGSAAATVTTATTVAVEESSDDYAESGDERELAPQDVTLQITAAHRVPSPRTTEAGFQEAVVANKPRPPETTPPSARSHQEPTPRHAAGRTTTVSRSAGNSESAPSFVAPSQLDTDQSHAARQQQQHLNEPLKNALPTPNASQSSRNMKSSTEAAAARANKDRINLGSMAARGQHW